MAHEQLKTAALPRALSDVVADLADLFQKEMRLARAEISAKISTKVMGGVWMAVAGVLGLVAALVLIEALIFGIASFGVALHWSCLIVAAALLAGAAGAFFKGRADAKEDLTPNVTIRQIKQDITAAKEQLS
jgi:apolipoprotein N-acyltransferase